MSFRPTDDARDFALEAFGIGSWSVQFPDGPVRWDERISALLGSPPRTDPWRWVERFVHPDGQRLLREGAEDLHSGAATVGPIRIESRTGDPVWLRLAATAKTDGQGRLVLIEGCAIDVSEHVWAQRRLARTTRLETLAHFSAGVSHNFNNMLTVIIACLEQLPASLSEAGRWSHESDTLLADATAAAERAGEVVAQLARIVRADPPDSRKLVSVGHVCQEMARLVRRVFPKEIGFEQELRTSAYVELPPGSLQQVLSNVLINARDALVSAGTEAPKVTLEVSVADVFGEETVQILVRDNGPGIPDELLDRIFEPFVTTKGAGGTGLGLASAAAFLEQHGGQIICRNAAARGAEFLIQLPASHPPKKRPRSETTSAPSPTAPAGARVLAVDDEVPILRIMERGLGRAGFVVETASDHATAEALIRGGQPFDLIFLDRSLGATEGDLLVPLIRSEMPACKILMFTGNPQDPEDAPDIDRMLSKPMSVPEIVDAAKEALATVRDDS